MSTEPFVSLIIPCYNEEKSIASLIGNILRFDYPRQRMEAFLVDGMSTDRTRELISEASAREPFIRLLVNEKRFVPFALNLGIEKARGEVIIRLDAHSEYPADYVSRLVRQLYLLNADNVGGVWETLPSGASAKAGAIASALSSAFGVGDSKYRLGAKEIMKVDTVPYGCFRKELFGRIGMFDEELLRNQDDEFNARIIQNGGSIYLIPDLLIRYYARPDARSLARMLYQYGYFKPLVNKKLKKPATLRQFVPPLFALFLVAGWVPSLFSVCFLYAYAGGLSLYILLDLYFSFRNSVRGKLSWLAFLPWIFPLQHLSYGFGYLSGIVNFVFLNRTRKQISSSR